MPRSILVAVVIVGMALGAVAGLAMWQQQAGGPSVHCSQPGVERTVVIRGGVVNPEITNANQCDRLIIINTDPVTRKLGFGAHARHVPYDGVSERILARGESLTITLRQSGEFTFHDHFEEPVGGKFVVTRQ